ncbi:cytochrome P450 [Chaetomium tenue]|uniref:Cytochrome P450 n=1 Tax=Chaetomium tenue TaxID=1854479 RepID=A0ACB7PDW2_9PEZI|nr:cytochrome P450 [Chaetomium globosum]
MNSILSWTRLANVSRVDYICAGLATLTVYVVYSAIWRLYMSPIAHFPGPRLAALTDLYEAYYNNWLGGKYIWKIDELHKEYGPIVRISPRDLHVGDPDFYDVLYPSTTDRRRADKAPSLTRFFGLDNSLFSTVSHDVHRMRRAALLPYFSPSHARRLQPAFQELLDVLLQRLADLKDTDEPVNANCVFAAFSNDMTHILAFGESQHKLETPDFDSSERDASLSGAQSFHILKRAPWLNNVMMALPAWLSQNLNPALGSFMCQKKMTREKVAQLASTSDDDWAGKNTPVFRGLLHSPKLPAEEKTVERVAEDAQMLLMAGTLTMASTLEHLIYWMVSNPDVLRKLKEELRSAIPSVNDVGNTPLATLEGLPPGRSPDIQGRDDGKELGDSVRDTCGHDERAASPQRGPFSRHRICLGMPQGYGVLRLVLSQIWRLAEDVRMVGDFFVAAYKKPQGVEFKLNSM